MVYGNALEQRVLARARPGLARAAIGLTPNDEVNSLFARECRDDHDVPQTYVVINTLTRGMTPSLVEKQGSHMAFDGPKDVERWNVRFRHGIAHIERFHFVGAPESAEESEAGTLGRREGDPYVILAVERAGAWQVMHAALAPRTGDVAAVAIHEPEATEAHTRLGRAGWSPGETLAPEEEPEKEAEPVA